jgi:hypothetical protein
VIYDVLRRVLQQGAEEGEVRDYPTDRKGSAWVKLTVGREMAARRHEDGAGDGGSVARRRCVEWGGAWGPARRSGGVVWPAAALAGVACAGSM